MKILVIGAHGKVALELAPRLRRMGDGVTGIIRNPAHADEVAAAGATPVVADIETLDTEALATLMRGQDAVIWSAGAGGGNPQRTYAVDRDAAIRSMDAAEQAGVGRYLMVSYLGAGPDHGVDPESSFFPYAEAKAAADQHLKASGLKWTILGPSGLTLDPGTGRIETGEDLTSGRVPRADVAEVAAQAIHRDDTIGRFIAFNTGDTPIADALAG
ncbi:SDR family oxidoreductase [Granulicoccus phenolivorans]|uniref:SDR family oxidoreductase n=1 Tax=Granulicoccus phenolivorans TaxID=266854 RepID=UPI000413F518|nr:SDR family oxidoreductase [Granulicoccus phenolivorans]